MSEKHFMCAKTALEKTNATNATFEEYGMRQAEEAWVENIQPEVVKAISYGRTSINDVKVGFELDQESQSTKKLIDLVFRLGYHLVLNYAINTISSDWSGTKQVKK